MDLAYTIIVGTNADRGGFHVLMSCGFSSSVFSCFIGWISCRVFCSCYLSISQVYRHQVCMVMSLGPAWNGVVHLHTLGNNHRRPRHVGEFTISSGIRQYCFMVNKEFLKISLLGLCNFQVESSFVVGMAQILQRFERYLCWLLRRLFFHEPVHLRVTWERFLRTVPPFMFYNRPPVDSVIEMENVYGGDVTWWSITCAYNGLYRPMIQFYPLMTGNTLSIDNSEPL